MNFQSEINFVSRTEIHLFMTRDPNDTIKTTPPSNTGLEGTNFETGSFPPAVLIKNPLVGAFVVYFLSDFINPSNASFPRKKREK